MNVLLTGGAGYIGSHIAVELQEQGYGVVIADNFSNSSPEVIARIEEITGKRPILCEIDMTDKASVDAAFRTNKPDAVIHLAGLKAVGESVDHPLMYYRNNLDSALTVLEAMRAHGVGKLIFSSSATVYGLQSSLPYTEDMPHGQSTNPYGSTKQIIERIIFDACADRKMNAVILRYFNPVGAHRSGLIGESPRGIPNNLMPYIMQVATGKLPSLNVYGDDYPTRDGTGIRDYIHVTDLAKGHIRALSYNPENSGVEVFNLGTGRGYSVLEIITAFEKVNRVKIPFTIAPRRAGDLAENYADASKAERLLSWKAELSLEDMCGDSYRYSLNLNDGGGPETR